MFAIDFPTNNRHESIADHEKPADLALSARLLNTLQRAVKSRPLIRFQGWMAAPRVGIKTALKPESGS